MVEPAPLGEGQVRDLLLRSGVQDADVGRLLAQTRGLPMLVREYVEGLRSAAGDGGERWWPPASVRELLRRRLQAASEPTLQMLSTAAVLGSGCDADLLRAVSGRGETETVEALDEAVRRFLLTETPPAGDAAGRPMSSRTRPCGRSSTTPRPWPGAGCCMAGPRAC